jgi:hypothetical protein
LKHAEVAQKAVDKLGTMSEAKQNFEEAKRQYLVAIKKRSDALLKTIDAGGESEEYPTLVEQEETAKDAYHRAADELYKSHHPTKSGQRESKDKPWRDI